MAETGQEISVIKKHRNLLLLGWTVIALVSLLTTLGKQRQNVNMENSCLQCHGRSFSGGTGMAVKLKPYNEYNARMQRTAVTVHILFWLIGCGGLVFFSRLRREQQKRIERNEWKFRIISESSLNWEYWLSEKNEIVYMSPSCERITGYLPAEFTSNQDLLADIIHIEDRDLYLNHMKEAAEGEQDGLELRIVRKDGQLRWLSHSCAALYKGGDFLGRRVSNKDITGRKQAEAALRHSETRLNEAQRIAHIGSWELDLATNTLFWSDEIYSIFEIDPNSFGASYEAFLNMVHPEDRAAVDEAYRTSVKNRTTYAIDHRLRLPDGRIKYVSEQCYTFYDSGGRPVRSLGTVQDITEKKKLEEQLRQAQKMEAIGTLAGGIAHDFNNILNVIMGYGDLLKMRMPEDSPDLPYLDEILSAAQRATHLTRGLLVFSRAHILELGPVNVGDLIEGMKKMVFRIIGEDIDTHISFVPGALTVLADHVQLEQVLINFATNARDAMPEGGTLTISARLFEIDSEFIHMHGYGKAGRYALISVSDTGKGMDAGTRERIFEPFFTTKEAGKGTGLGLYIVYGIVKQHNGYINCYSEPGRGTTFNVYIPLLGDGGHEAGKGVEIGGQIIGGCETILLAEDDHSIRKLTKEMLRKFGYKVIEACDGEEAVSLFEGNKGAIDLLLFDLIMPRKSGRAAFEEIVKMRPDIKVLFVSGYADDILVKMKVREENADQLQKPVSTRALLQKIRMKLDDRSK